MKFFTLKKQELLTTMLFFAFLLAGAFSAAAQEYKSMIRYDRIWEHVSVDYSDREVYHVRFDGTEEINGKTYHRLAAFRKASYAYGSDGQPYVFDVDNNYYQNEGYMREEGGKVYTLIVKDDSDDHNPWMHIYNPAIYVDLDPSKIEEGLLYDFTCGIGDTYRGIHIQPGGAMELDYKVKAIEHIDIDGEDHRIQRVIPYDGWLGVWNDDFNEPMVEGIGIASYGCLTIINFMFRPTCPCMSYIFNRVLSTDGKVLYRAEHDCADIPLDGFLGVDGISEITDTPKSDAPCYDILGRRIAAPAPGQLYIQGARKHIAK